MSAYAYPRGMPEPREQATIFSQNGSAATTAQLQPRGYRPVDGEFAIAPAVSVVIPVKNEARNLPIVFGSLPGWISEVVLVDGQSVDDTVAVAKELYPDIKIVHQVGRGQGRRSAVRVRGLHR